MERKKQHRRQYTAEFKRQALERMKTADSIVALAEELGISRVLLYQWEAVAEGRGRSRGKQATAERQPAETELELRYEVAWLRDALARKMKELDFFRSALQKVEERRQWSADNGGTASTTKSGQ